MNISIGTQQFNNHTSRVYTVSFISSRVQCLNTENRTFYLTIKLKLNVLYTILAVKNLSAVSRHPCRPSISVFREKRKKAEERCAIFPLETTTLVKKTYKPTWRPTILDKINGKPRPPLPPKSRMGKWRVFALRAPSSLIWGGWGFAVPFYFVQDCRCCRF